MSQFSRANAFLFDVVLFDFDGTIVDSGLCGVLATQAAFAEFDLIVPSEQSIIQLMGIPIEKSFKQFGADKLSTMTFEDLLVIFRQKYTMYSSSHIKLYAGMLNLLATCKQNKQLTGIVSSKKSAVIHNNCHVLGIDKFIDVVIGSDSVTNYKPHPEGLQQALVKLGKPDLVERTIYIGDATTDIQMGTSFKVKTCAVTWGAHSKQELNSCNPSYIVDSVSQLEHILSAI